MIFREFFPRGLTALDDLNEATLGTRPTMSHVTARQEVAALVNAMALTAAKGMAAAETADQAREAA
jgi:chromosome partitioning protein